ncbi:hypothetical protein PVK06_048487 [Gossypium arboreum]|uniref:Uncharacterized protein n=1 Tax=Gossypium arboreum TaxID=29729 RepID=A0ABR0MGE4_GOSAR|nr:hypothetical protein PVK06_048487 [Gossypium arboreum]
MKNSQNLFYAYTKAWNSSIVATLSQLSPSLIPNFLVFPPIIQNYEHSSLNDDFKDRDRLVASLPIMQVSDNDKDEESKDIEECFCKIDSLFEDEEIIAEEEKVVEEVKEREEEDSYVNIVTTPESVGANIDNLELDGMRPTEVAEVTNEEQDNSLEIVAYTGPLQVASSTQVVTDDAGAELELEE